MGRTGVQALEQCYHCVSWNEWLLSQVRAIPQLLGKWQRCYHAGNPAWQSGFPLSYCGSGGVSVLRGVQQMPVVGTGPTIEGPKGQVAKNLGEGGVGQHWHQIPIETLPQTSYVFEHSRHV
jgi:hypothetical protein